ncbi:PREDICTED: subtilisin-like protease SBT2.5 isoform X4 [Camelina sativa]|uniref:Subtilisin-like protease SBT2.5 isoform X4 n=1 Tax=Camelina sativa TaxID=90675 RepID=A0ABM1R1Y1_CAMSA|nr:PREDICTED: subtilisin-like protease SBT2.5 isoform X4 [Camelina sativa]
MNLGLRIFVVSALLVTVAAEVYIVTMDGDPIISYKGGENGFEATAVKSDERIDTSSELVTMYARHLERKHDMILGMLFEEGSYKKLYSYKHLINGFAAHVSPEQVMGKLGSGSQIRPSGMAQHQQRPTQSSLRPASSPSTQSLPKIKANYGACEQTTIMTKRHHL